MNKRKKGWLIFTILMILLVGGIAVRYMTVKQSQANVANEQREAQEKVAKYLVHHYRGIKTMEIGRLYKPNSVGGGDYYVPVKINNCNDLVFVGADNKRSFDDNGPEIDSYDPDFLDKSGVIEDLDNSRTLSNLKIKYTEKSNDELRE